ncbi:MAG: hypothetical protein MJ252_20055, partial [archaeon]|nr:hypothetical protein [archaeon]
DYSNNGNRNEKDEYRININNSKEILQPKNLNVFRKIADQNNHTEDKYTVSKNENDKLCLNKNLGKNNIKEMTYMEDNESNTVIKNYAENENKMKNSFDKGENNLKEINKNKDVNNST